MLKLKKRIEYQITVLENKNLALQKNLDFLDLLKPYLDYISTSGNKKDLEAIGELLNASLYRLKDPIINSLNSKEVHPKTSFFQFLTKLKGIPSNDLSLINYPDVYSFFQEYLTYLANDWTSYSFLKLIKLDFDIDKLSANITKQHDLEKYKTKPRDFFNDFIKVTAFQQEIKNELIKNEIESLELNYDEKSKFLTFKLKPKENTKNEYQFVQTEFTFNLETKKDITSDFLKPKIELKEKELIKEIKHFSRFKFIDFINKNPNWIIKEHSKYINQSVWSGDDSLDKFLKEELMAASVTYDLDTFYSSDGKKLKFSIKSKNYDFGSFELDNLLFLGDLFENNKPNYLSNNKKVFEINLYDEINKNKDHLSNTVSIQKIKDIIIEKLTSFLKEKGFNFNDFKTNIEDNSIIDAILKKLLSNQTSIKEKRNDYIEISLSLKEPSLGRLNTTNAEQNVFYFRFTNIKPFDFKKLKIKDIVLNINTIFSESYTDFEYETRYKQVMKDIKETISITLLNQFKTNNNLGNTISSEDFITKNKDDDKYHFNFEYIPYNLKKLSLNIFNKDEDERQELLDKYLESLFYALRTINLGIDIPPYLKQYYLNSEEFNISIQNKSNLVKLVDFSNLAKQVDKSLENTYPNWKSKLNDEYKIEFSEIANKLGVPRNKLNSAEAFLNIPKIIINDAFNKQESILQEEINKKLVLLKNELNNKILDNNSFLVKVAKSTLEMYGNYIHNQIKDKLSAYTKLINESYDKNFFDIEQFIEKEKGYKFSYLKLFNFLIPNVDFSTVKSINSLLVNKVEHIKKSINIVPSKDENGKEKWGFNDIATSLDIAMHKNIIFEIQWMKYIVELDKKYQGYFMLPESLKTNLYKKYGLDLKNDDSYLPNDSPDNPQGNNDPNNSSSNRNNGKPENNFKIKEHLWWIILLSLIMPLGTILFPILVLRLKKIKKLSSSNKKDSKNNKDDEDSNNSTISNSQDGHAKNIEEEKELSEDIEKPKEAVHNINDIFAKLLKKKENKEETKN